jgi:hypothetical protein
LQHSITISPAQDGKYEVSYRGESLGLMARPVVETARTLIAAGANPSDTIIASGPAMATMTPVTLAVAGKFYDAPRWVYTPPPSARR